MSSAYFNAAEECADRTALAELQTVKLRRLLGEVTASNLFYHYKLHGMDIAGSAASVLRGMPFTTRAEIEADQSAHPPYGTNLTYPLDQYCRYHQTSGSHGHPVRWLDTADNWAWFGKCWQTIFAAAGVTRADRLFFAFSFGPFVGFWAAFESAAAAGFLCIPAGGVSTVSRLRMILQNRATVVFCTPTYALRMAEVAQQEGIDLPGSSVRVLIVAGEPGGSIPETKARIESAWGARLFDHTGMTEIGAMSFECAQRPGGVHVIESEFIAESINPRTGEPVENGELGELVLTNLGRVGSPLLRYRTGDLVRLTRSSSPCACGRTFARLEGGILGRADDMFIVRGNNVFPTAVEAVLRGFPDVQEFRVHIYDSGPLTHIALEIEPTADAVETQRLPERVASALQASLSFRAEVKLVAPATLPRFEMKSQRFVRSKAENIA